MRIAAPPHRVVVIEAEIDDMNPQIFGVLIDRLLGDGALDVFYTSIQMKKNRPGTLLTIVAPPGARERLAATVFRETTTIGIRYREINRECLDRETFLLQGGGRVEGRVAGAVGDQQVAGCAAQVGVAHGLEIVLTVDVPQHQRHLARIERRSSSCRSSRRRW